MFSLFHRLGWVKNDSVENRTNIVCFRPDYLFKDLVSRFEEAGCVFSDLPMEGYSSYIWMRPQEIWHLEYLSQNKSHEEIPNAYKQEYAKRKISFKELQRIKAVSVAIHHGTCFKPLYQFCYKNLAASLRNVKAVVGVCPFQECYGPSANLASQNNFFFKPIGFDDQLFNERKILDNDGEEFVIGFVGRNYGMLELKSSSSELDQPLGYRKGEDILLNILLRLKSTGVKFRLSLLGCNWTRLVENLEKYGIPYDYHDRNNGVSYEKDYPSLYSHFDCLLIAARCEGGPVTALEALALGVPIVGTNVGILPFLNKLLDHSDFCQLFSFDPKWGTVDYEKAVNIISCLLENKKNRTVADRLLIREKVLPYTTKEWIRLVMKLAKENSF